MNYSLGAFVMGAGHVLGWLAIAAGLVIFAMGLADQRSMMSGMLGLTIIAGAVPSLILATIGSAQLVTARANERMAELMEAEALEKRTRSVHGAA